MSEYIYQRVYDYFELLKRDTTIAQEFLAGTNSFLAVSYILFVNPYFFSFIGIRSEYAVISTGLSAGIGCIISGLFSNLPFVVAPGLGFSAYLTCGLMLGLGLTMSQTFTSCFVAGMLVGICTISGLSGYIIKIVPRSVQIGTPVGIGLLVALIGLSSVNLIDSNVNTIVGLGSIWNFDLWFSIGGLVLLGSLLHHKIPGAMFLGIVTISLMWWIINGYKSFPTIYRSPQVIIETDRYLDFESLNYSCIAPILGILFAQLFDVNGVIYGIAPLAKLVTESGDIPSSEYTFIAVSIGSMVATMMGCSPLTVHLESASGIVCGGRTGLSAMVTGMYFILSTFFSPLLGFAPAVATSPVLIVVGTMMMAQSKLLDWSLMDEAIPAFLTLVVIPFTFSLANGLIFGFVTSFCFSITTGKAWKWFKRTLSKIWKWAKRCVPHRCKDCFSSHDYISVDENSSYSNDTSVMLQFFKGNPSKSSLSGGVVNSSQRYAQYAHYKRSGTVEGHGNGLGSGSGSEWGWGEGGGEGDSDIALSAMNVRTPSLLITKEDAEMMEMTRGGRWETLTGSSVARARQSTFIEITPSMSTRPIY